MISKTTFLFLILAFQFLFGQTYIVPDLQRDDFDGTTLHSWWKVGNYPASDSDHQITVNNGYLKAVLKDPLGGANGGRLQSDYNGMENVGFSNVTDKIYDKHMLIDIRIRIKTLNALPTGSRGWGSWRSEGVPISINQNVWFMQQTANQDSSWGAAETWWRARSDRGVESVNDIHTDLDGAPYSIDNTQWHTYRIVRNSESTSTGYYDHYVDGTLVQHVTPNDFTPAGIISEDYEFHCWNDNLVYYHTQNAISGNDTIEVFYNGWLGTSSFVVDFIEIYKDGYSPKYEVSPVNSSDFLRLRKYESEIDDGVTDGLWKSYSFDTYSDGNTFIIITGKAENLGSYDADDNMKVVVDGSDFGYNNSNSWDGDTDAGQPKTLVFSPTLASGNHTLEIYSQTTPILYDVNVLNSASGSLVLDQTVNETAPAGSNNYLWKQFTFSCDAGPAAIYVSASADDEPGWDYKSTDIDGTDDDELRIELDNTDYGWGGSNGFVGNTLHGDVKTVLIKDTLTAGSHTLKLYANETPTVYRVIVFAQNGDYSLPVTFSSFTASKAGEVVHLNWRTESEINNYGFTLLRAFSADSTMPGDAVFAKLNREIIPGHGNSSRGYDYSFDDTLALNVPPYVWYRLYSLDYDGTKHLLKTISLKTMSDPIVGSSRLFMNYPNPFNPFTKIYFKLSDTQRVDVAIFDLQGRKVRTLWQGVLNAGEHSLIWDARDAAGVPQSAGIYFYRIKTEHAQWVGKMTLLK